jgi:anti-sigma regulatory factor (Ser/Thr protein kinase)
MKKNSGSGNAADSFDREIELPAVIDNLDRLLEWVAEALEEVSCTGKLSSQITVVAEELFVNIASYAYRGTKGEAAVRIGFDGRRIILQFEDSGIAFNPLEQEIPDVMAGIEDRSIGGLGIYLTRKWMDEITYKRDNEKNILTLYKTAATGA